MKINHLNRKQLKQILNKIRSDSQNEDLLQRHKNSFTSTDIRGLNFSGLNLTEFDFSRVTAGVSDYWASILTIFSAIIIIVFILIIEFAAQRTVRQFIFDVSPDKADETVVNRLFGIYTFGMFLVPIWTSIFKTGLTRSVFFTSYAGMLGVLLTILCCLFLLIISILTGNLSTSNDWNGFSAIFSNLFGKNVTGGITGVVMILASTIIAISFTLVDIVNRNKIVPRITILASYLFASLLGFIGFKDYHIISVIITAGSGLAAIGCAGQITKQSLIENEKYKIIKNIAITISALFGTKFKDSILDYADFSSAHLISTDLRQLNSNHNNLLHTNWNEVTGLNNALLTNTILEDKKVRELLISPKNGVGKDFKNCNFTGANLSKSDLSCANLTAVNFSNTSLRDAILRKANLTRVIALGTNFLGTDINEACIDSLNVDNRTNFTDIKGEFIYLLNPGKDRYPVEGYLLPGDLENYLRKKLGTVDFIFRDGVNTPSFVAALEQYKTNNLIRIESENKINIEIYSIENQGDNIAIKVTIPDDESKENFHADIMSHYNSKCLELEQAYGLFLNFNVNDISDIDKIKKELTKIKNEIYPMKVDVIINATTINQNFFGEIKTVIGNLFKSNLISKESSKGFFTTIGKNCDIATNSLSSPKEKSDAIQYLKSVDSTYSMVRNALGYSKDERIQ